jgi:hypothetical protein
MYEPAHPFRVVRSWDMLPTKGVSLKILSGPATPMTRMGFAPACKAVRRGVLGFGVAASEPGPRLGERD